MSFWSKASELLRILTGERYGCSFVALLGAMGLAIAAALVRNVGDADSQAPRRTASMLLMLLSGVVFVLDASLFLVHIGRWGYLLALLPGTAITRHAVYMRLIRRRALSSPVPPPTGLRPPETTSDSDGDTLEAEDPGLLVVFARARRMHDRDFAPDTLVARFGIPALLTTFIGIGVFEFLISRPFPNAPQAMRAAWFGAAGGMVYVLLYLGQRAFRNDITSGAALWSAIVLALGPLFGAVFSYLWGEAQGSGAGTGATASTQLSVTRDALYFVAGMAPRHAASAVEEAVRRLWLVRTPSNQTQSRLQPLAQLRGVAPAIEDRLAEEGIVDIQGMAMADPLKLLRSTSFDKRQILSWIDEALLMTWLPEQWSAVQKVGVTGAIDLMAHVQQRETQLRGVLASAGHLDPAAVDAVILAGTILKEDTQLRLVWALYQFDADAGEEPATETGPAAIQSTPGGLAPPALGWLLSGLGLTVLATAVDGVTVTASYALVLGAFVVAASAIAITARWPWANSRARALPLLLAVLAVGTAIAVHRGTAHAGDWRWALRSILGAAAAASFGVFVVGVVTTTVGCMLTVEFPNGAPPDSELSVGDRPIDIGRSATSTTPFRVAARRTELVLRCPGLEPQRRWLDLRGQHSARVGFSLPATVVLQPVPPEARVLRLWVDSAETAVGTLRLPPRAVPYVITAEAYGFLLANAPILVATAETIPALLLFQPRPPAPTDVSSTNLPQEAPIPVDLHNVTVVRPTSGTPEASGRSEKAPGRSGGSEPVAHDGPPGADPDADASGRRKDG